MLSNGYNIRLSDIYLPVLITTAHPWEVRMVHCLLVNVTFVKLLLSYLATNGIRNLLVLTNVPFRKNPHTSKFPSIFKIFVLMAIKFNWLIRHLVNAVSSI